MSESSVLNTFTAESMLSLKTWELTRDGLMEDLNLYQQETFNCKYILYVPCDNISL